MGPQDYDASIFDSKSKVTLYATNPNDHAKSSQMAIKAFYLPSEYTHLRGGDSKGNANRGKEVAQGS
jgi:hypothetical protein